MHQGYSCVDKHSITYKWEVKEVTSFMSFAVNTINGPSTIESPKFSTGSRNNDQWHLSLTIKSEYDTDKKENICISLHPVSKPKPKAKYRVFILNKNKEKYDFGFSAVSHPYEKYNCGCLMSWEDYSPFNDIYDSGYFMIANLLKKADEFLPEDTLTIFVDLTVYDDHVSFSNTTIPLEGKAKDHLIEDLKKLFNTEEGSDFSVVVGGKIFRAHKSILIARSPVFYTKFLLESNEKIKNIRPAIFEKILEFIYTAKIENLDEDAEELLEAANKCELQGLREVCEFSISNTLNNKNAIRILILADCCDAKLLMDFSTKFIILNFAKISNTKEFEDLEKSHPLLYFGLLKKYAAGIKN